MPRLVIRHGSLLVLVLMSLAPAGAPPAIAADVAPLIRILEPVDGAVVKSPVSVRVEVLNSISALRRADRTCVRR
jgi:hypothetical protein